MADLPFVWVVIISYDGPSYRNPGCAEEFEIEGVAMSEVGADKLVAEARRRLVEEQRETLFSEDTEDTWSCDVHKRTVQVEP